MDEKETQTEFVPVEENIDGIAPAEFEAVGVMPDDTPNYSKPAGYTLEQAADTVNIAQGVGQPIRAITPYELINTLEGRMTSPLLDKLSGDIWEEELQSQQDAAIYSLKNAELDAEQRLDAAMVATTGDGKVDYNQYARKAGDNIIVGELATNDDPDVEDSIEGRTEMVESVPKNITAIDNDMSPEETRDAVLALIDYQIQQADRGTQLLGTVPKSLLDVTKSPNPVVAAAGQLVAAPVSGFSGIYQNSDNYGELLGTMVPMHDTAWIAAVMNKMDLQTPLSEAGNVLPGEALRMIRERLNSKYASKDYEGLASDLGRIMEVLKFNAGPIKDGNDFLTFHVLSSVFGDIQNGTAGQPDKPGILNRALSNLMPTEELQDAVGNSSFRWGDVLDNFTGILDVVGMGSVSKSLVANGRRTLPRILGRLNKASPDVAANTAVDILSDPRVRAKFGNLLDEDIVEHMLPVVDHAMRSGDNLQGLGAILRRQLEQGAALERQAVKGYLDQKERAAAFESILKEYGALRTKKVGKYHVASSVSSVIDNGNALQIDAVFGLTETRGFGTIRAARKAAKVTAEEVFGEGVPYKIVKLDPTTNTFVDVAGDVKETARGSFFIQATDKRNADSARSVMHALTFDPGDMSYFRFAPGSWLAKGLDAVGIGNFRNPGSQFSKEVVDSIIQMDGSSAEWQRLAVGMVQEVDKLGLKQKNILNQALRAGEQEGVDVFSRSRLSEMGLDDDAQRAYYSMRNAADVMYRVANRALRNQDMASGYKQFLDDAGEVGVARLQKYQDVLDGAVSKRHQDVAVFDPRTRKFINMSFSALDDLYKKGHSLAELKVTKLGQNGEEASHILVPAGGNVRARVLPYQYLPKVKGYYTHISEGNFVVYGKTARGTRVALGLASNRVDAEAIVAEKMASVSSKAAKGKGNTLVEFGYDYDGGLASVAGKANHAYEQYVNTGGAVFGSRNNGELQNFSPWHGDIDVDPVEALVRGMEQLGDTVSRNKLANTLRQRLYNYADSQGVLKNKGYLPATADDLVKTAGKEKEYEKSLMMLKQINNTEYMPDAVSVGLSTLFDKMSVVAAKFNAKALSKKFSDWATSGPNPLGAMMGFQFRKSISTNVLAQFTMNAMQTSVIASIAPKQFLLNGWRAIALSEAVISRALSQHPAGFVGKTAGKFMTEDLEASAKLAGMELKEFTKLVDTVFDSGLVSSTALHTAMRDGIRSSAQLNLLNSTKAASRGKVGYRVGQALRGADNAYFGTLSTVGFEAGENLNRLTTFMVRYLQHKEEGIADLGNPDYVRRLVGDTIEIAGGQTPGLRFTAQRGVLKTAFQFLAFHVKQAQLVWPASLGGSRRLSGPEKFRMMVMQTLMWGSHATVFNRMFYRGLEHMIYSQNDDEQTQTELQELISTPEFRQAVEGGIADSMVNTLLRAGLGDGAPKLAVAGSLAPGGGGEFALEQMKSMFTMNPEEFGGLSGKTTSEVYQFLKFGYQASLGQIMDVDNVSLEDRAEEFVAKGVTLSNSYANRLLQARVAEQLEGWLGKSGQLVPLSAEDTGDGINNPQWWERHAYSTFGIETYEKRSYYDARDAFNTRMSVDATSRDKEISGLADEYIKQMVATVARNYEGADGREEFYRDLNERFFQDQSLLFSVLRDDEKEAVVAKIEERLDRIMQEPTTNDEIIFVETATKKLREGQFGKEGNILTQKLLASPFVQNDSRLENLVRDTANYMMEE